MDKWQLVKKEIQMTFKQQKLVNLIIVRNRSSYSAPRYIPNRNKYIYIAHFLK